MFAVFHESKRPSCKETRLGQISIYICILRHFKLVSFLHRNFLSVTISLFMIVISRHFYLKNETMDNNNNNSIEKAIGHRLHKICSCIRVAVCLPMFFPNKTNINSTVSFLTFK